MSAASTQTYYRELCNRTRERLGVSTNNSVEATARTAGNLGCRTDVVSDATFAFDKADYSGTLRTAAEVHAMSLANLEDEYAATVNTQEMLSLLSQLEG